MGTTHHLIVNGESHDVMVDYDDTPLLYVLRDNLGLKGVRFGSAPTAIAAPARWRSTDAR